MGLYAKGRVLQQRRLITGIQLLFKNRWAYNRSAYKRRGEGDGYNRDFTAYHLLISSNIPY